MKKYSLIFTSLLIITGMGCKKDFLEQSNPNAVTVENAYNTETDITTGEEIGQMQQPGAGEMVGPGEGAAAPGGAMPASGTPGGV